MPAPQASNLTDPRKDIDGTKPETWPQSAHPMIRLRPWAPPGPNQVNELRAQHLHPVPPVFDITSHAIRDSKAVYITMTSGDMPPVDGKQPTYGSGHIWNFEIADIGRSGPASQEHCDGVHVIGMRYPDIRPDFIIERGWIHDTDGSVQNILINGGYFGTVTLRNIVCERVGNVSTCKSNVNLLIIDNCPGLRLNIQADAGHCVQCIVKNSPAAHVVNVSVPNGSGGQIPSTTPIQMDAASSGIVVGPTPPPAPPPPVSTLPPLPGNVAGLIVFLADGTIYGRRSGQRTGVTVAGLFDNPLSF